MSEIIQWPVCVLTPQQASADLVPFSRSGGRTLGGIEPSTRTDLGFWSVTYSGIVMQNRERRAWQTWNAIRQKLGGRPGLIAVRVRSSLSAPYVSGKFEPVIETDHSDDSPFDDDTPYTQGAISVVTDGVTAVGATSIRLRIINADANLVGVRFSYNHALYETGPVTAVDGDIWTVPISPSVRELIPAGADLEFDQPTCLCHLAEDRGMDIDQNAVGKFSLPSVSFVEAVDYWNQQEGCVYKVIDLLEDENTTVETTLNEWAAKGYEPFQVIRRATYSWRLILKRGPVVSVGPVVDVH